MINISNNNTFLNIEEENFLKNYNPNLYERPIGVPADIVIFSITSEKDIMKKEKSYPIRKLKIMLIKRKGHPDKGKWALPGGFSNPNETLYNTAKRELAEETGVNGIHVELLNVYDKPKRDKRGWVISVAYIAIVNEKYLEKRKASDDAEDVKLFTIEEALNLNLAFDHRDIILDAKKIIDKKIIETKIAKEFLPEEFTLRELSDVIQAVIPNYEIDSGNFNRKLTKTKSRKGIIEVALNNDGEQKYSNQFTSTNTKLFKFTNEEPNFSIYG